MEKDYLRTCVHPSGRFAAGIHRPSFTVANNRMTSAIMSLGKADNGTVIDNRANFPQGDLHFASADKVYEVPNAFPMWGVTYILGDIAEKNGSHGPDFSFIPRGDTSLEAIPGLDDVDLRELPRPILLTIAQLCTHVPLLLRLLPLCADFIFEGSSTVPAGLRFVKGPEGMLKPSVRDSDLYETLGNNPWLPDEVKAVMLLNPGIQGHNPIVGEYVSKDRTHIWEYLRANSYIPWGHFAANMAQDAVRYSVRDLDMEDVRGLRHLYYQRTYCRLAADLNAGLEKRGLMSPMELEELRLDVLARLRRLMDAGGDPFFTACLWGWNYGYDFSPSGFRLHASHQQIHQQFALIPARVQPVDASVPGMEYLPSYAAGDNVAWFATEYRRRYGVSFFDAYVHAIQENRRMDGRDDLPSSLVIEGDENAILFVPKAQRSQGELQIMTLKPVSNILEADLQMRQTLDRLIFKAVRALDGLGARMITCFEISGRFLDDPGQRLIYCFLPRHPRSPGAFSERQGRWITGHFPEDYARCCRDVLLRQE